MKIKLRKAVVPAGTKVLMVETKHYIHYFRLAGRNIKHSVRDRRTG